MFLATGQYLHDISYNEDTVVLGYIPAHTNIYSDV